MLLRPKVIGMPNLSLKYMKVVQYIIPTFNVFSQKQGFMVE